MIIIKFCHLSRHFLYAASCLCISFYTSFSLAAISLDATINAGADIKIERVAAMKAIDDDTWVAIDAEHGHLITFRSGVGTVTSLSGEGGAFDSSDISGLADFGDGQLLVSNSGDDSVVIVGADGKLIGKLVTSGSDAGQVDDPVSVAWSTNRRLYVADSGNNRISVFGADGVFIMAIGQHGLDEERRLQEPATVAIDPMERVYVLEKRDDGIVNVFAADGSSLARFTSSDIKKITGNSVEIAALAVDAGGLLYLADNSNGRVYQLDWQQQKLITSFGSKGEQRGQFERITAITVLADGRVAVADSDNRKIEIYRLPASGRQVIEQKRLPSVGYERDIRLSCETAYRIEGGNVLCLNDSKVASYKSSGKLAVEFTGEFSRVRAASVDDQDVVILDDDDLKIYKLDGKQRYKVGGSGEAAGKLDAPEGVYLRGDKIYVADTGNRRIQVFSSDGIFLDKISNPEEGAQLFSEPSRVVADANGNLFVLDKGKKQVLVFSAANKLLYKIGAAGEEDSEEDENKPTDALRFEEIFDITIDRDDNLYILAATASSRASVHIYNGPKQTIAFGAASEQRAGMQEPVSISIAPARKTVVSVYDNDKQTLLNYMYMQLPARVGGVKVIGDTDGASLSWQRAPGSYISRYKVYASRSADGPYRYVTDVSATEAKVKHEAAFADQFYRVSAVSGFSVEGALSNTREDVFQAGYALFRDLEYKQAEPVFASAHQKHPDNASVLKYLGLTAMELGKIDDAVAYFRELTQMKGYAVEGLNLQVDALVKNRDYVAAKAAIDKVIADDTASLDTIINCGELSLALGDAIGAVSCLEQAIAKAPDNTRAHFLMGQAYIKLGIVDKGLEEFATAVKIDPDNAEVHFQSGMAYLGLDKHEDAITAFNKALSLDDTHHQARLELARMHLELKQYDQARSIAIKLAGNKDTRAEGQYLLGLADYASEQYGQALLALNKATRADPGNAPAWLALADTYIKMNQPGKVRGILVKAVEGDDRSFEAASRLGKLDYDAGDFNNAAGYLELAASLKPEDAGVHYRLADSLYRTGAYKRAHGYAVTAAKLDAKNIAPLMLLADISNKQGKNGEAIDSIKKAMSLQDNSAELHTRLGALYVENSVFDLARGALEKAALLDATAARPHFLLGALFMQRRLFDEAISAYDKAISLDGSVENKLALDTAYAEKKKSMEFKSNAPSIVLKDLRLDKVFSAAYKQYSDKAIGSVRIQNTSAQEYGNLKLTFTIKGYMDFPATTELPLLKANAAEQIDLFAAFNNKILEIDEDTGVQVEVAVNFIRDGRDDSISITQPMTIYGKNAIVWGEANMIGSFVTPKDDTLRDFVRRSINENRPQAEAVDKSLLTAMTLFDVFGSHGIKYVVDPNSPYSDLTETTVDYVQFARETLKIKSGDCDDLSVLMSASLENLGIETAVVDVPGHLLMMFNTGLAESDRDLISLDDDLLVVRDGNIWIPVEATMIGQSFAEAWAEGARKYKKFAASNELGVVAMRDAWQTFKPVTLKPAGYNLKVPPTSHVSPMVQREKNLLLEKSLDRLVRPYRALVAMDADNSKAHMQIAIIYAKYGLHDAAMREFEAILKQQPENGAVYNNQGNIFFDNGDFERALENYSYAEKLASNDAGVKMNMSMAYYKQGDLSNASEKYEEASLIDSDITERFAGYVKLLSN